MPEEMYDQEYESVLLKYLGRSPQTRLIDFFMDNPLFDFMKKEIMEALSMNKRTLNKTLPLLEDLGIIIVSRKIGKAKLYKLDPENPAVVQFRNLERILAASTFIPVFVEEVKLFDEEKQQKELLIAD